MREHKHRTQIALAISLLTITTLSGCSGSEILGFELPFAPSVEDYKKSAENSDENLVVFEKVQDNFGEYKRTYVEAGSLTSAFSGENLAAAQAAIKFLSLEALDSIALDNGSRWEEWKANIAPQYIASQYLNIVLQTVPTYGGFSVSNVILSNVDNHLPTLMRDGGVRIADKRISDIHVYGENGTVSVLLEGTAVVYANDKEAAEWLKQDIEFYNSDGTLMTAEQKAEALKRTGQQGVWSGPTFQDGKPNVSIIKYSVRYDMVKEGEAWKIASFNNSFEVNQAMFEKNANSQLNFRDKLTK